METLTPAQRQQLKGLAHRLEPVVLIGNAGLTPAVLKEIDASLKAHELIKVKAGGAEREDRVVWLEQICSTLGAQPVQHIGKILVLYRQNPQPESTPKPAAPKRSGKSRTGTKSKTGTKSRRSAKPGTDAKPAARSGPPARAKVPAGGRTAATPRPRAPARPATESKARPKRATRPKAAPPSSRRG